MWDSGHGVCVVCGTSGDRDILGRCEACFRKNAPVPYCHFKEMGVENPGDPQGSTAHVRDIKARRVDVKTGKMYYDRGQRSYSFPKG